MVRRLPMLGSFSSGFSDAFEGSVEALVITGIGATLGNGIISGTISTATIVNMTGGIPSTLKVQTYPARYLANEVTLVIDGSIGLVEEVPHDGAIQLQSHVAISGRISAEEERALAGVVKDLSTITIQGEIAFEYEEGAAGYASVIDLIRCHTIKFKDNYIKVKFRC